MFRFNWRVTVFSVLCFTGFVYLGIWQLEREVEKRELVAQKAQRFSLPPLQAANLLEEGDLDGVPVRLVGEYLEPVLLLDNKVLKGMLVLKHISCSVMIQAHSFLLTGALCQWVEPVRTRSNFLKCTMNTPISGAESTNLAIRSCC